MIVWLTILIPPVIVGFICGYFLKNWIGIVLSGAVPWFGLLTFLLIVLFLANQTDVHLPVAGMYIGMYVSMWWKVQLFVGTIVAALGIGSYFLCRILLSKRKSKTADQLNDTE